jgi:fructose 1,6-bisphosphate aldolase/phosphatase
VGENMKITLSIIKADVGSIGGHTRPSDTMMSCCQNAINAAIKSNFLVDGIASFTGDDICLTLVHKAGKLNSEIHSFAWYLFKDATTIAGREGLYGAGQDLLVDAPSGNVRGAGPAVAEIEFELKAADRAAESFLIFAADKCGPGAYNLPLYLTFCDPMHDGGLLLNPKMRKGFAFDIIDMDNKDGDRVIRLDIPEEIWDAAVLLRDIDRFAIESIYSRYAQGEQIVSVSATRLHNIAGKYTGKDDPVAIIRTQGMFPAPEEVIEPYMYGHYVTGDARGSHNMPIMPMPINSAVTGAYCLPIVSCIAFSMNEAGKLSKAVDLFYNPAWNAIRDKIVLKAEDFRRQGFFGITMASKQELAYTGIVDAMQKLDERFIIRK